MNSVFSEHPSTAQLTAFGQGRLDPESAEAIADHVATCDSCCELLSEVPSDTLADNLLARSSDTTIDSTRSVAADHDPADLADHPRYRIVKVLGSGGMGIVFQAHHRVMDRPVALKVINRQLTTDPEIVERFRQEVRAAAKLSHPNIVTAHDAEQTGELHFLVMEFVDGIDLARYVKKKGPLPAGLVAHIGRQAALGLNHAARHEMVHRDIKPQNLIITQGGRVRILDFGLARLGRKESDRKTNGDDDLLRKSAAELTLAGSILGTPDYIAPEQASDSRKVDARSDIYSLGCTLYFLLTGHPPFPSGSVYSKLLAHQTQSPESLGAKRTDIPNTLLSTIERMMARDPDQRVQSAGLVAKSLHPLAKEWQNSSNKTVTSVSEKVDIPESTLTEDAATAATALLPNQQAALADVAATADASDRDGEQFPYLKQAIVAVVLVFLTGFAVWHSRDDNADKVFPEDGATAEQSSPTLQQLPDLIAPADTLVVQQIQRECASRLGLESTAVTVPLSDKVSLNMVIVPAGRFRPDAGLSGAYAETPLLFGDTEITVEQFRIFAESESYLTLAEREEGRGWGRVGNDYVLDSGYSWRDGGDFSPELKSPATNISWMDATAFCDWLNTRNLKVGNFNLTWRLPEEWEWEFACRAGMEADYYWGDDASEMPRYAVSSGNSGQSVSVVRSKLPNAFGLYDMLGNESEWCLTRFGGGSERVQRGGSFLSPPGQVHCAARAGEAPSQPTHGAFRVVSEFNP